MRVAGRGLVLLDRDGVLNRLVVDAEHGSIDSPLNPEQVEIYTDAPGVLAKLNGLGYGLAIVTNQPAWAKKKTSKENLNLVHQKIVTQIQGAGAVILSSHICFHRQEDECQCRKPKTALLEEAFAQNLNYQKSDSWMVGDAITDVHAGQALGLKTVFIGPKKLEYEKVFTEYSRKKNLDFDVKPTVWVETLSEVIDAFHKFIS